MPDRRPTAEEVWDVLDYQAQTGVFRWRRCAAPQIEVGAIAGHVSQRGYVTITLWGRAYPASHLAWLMMTGEWPKRLIDHRDLDKSNNRFENLRQASKGQNNANTPLRADNTSGVKGVSFHRGKGRWCAAISHGGKQRHLGSFPTMELAAAAYAAAAICLQGEFARL